MPLEKLETSRFCIFFSRFDTFCNFLFQKVWHLYYQGTFTSNLQESEKNENMRNIIDNIISKYLK